MIDDIKVGDFVYQCYRDEKNAEVMLYDHIIWRVVQVNRVTEIVFVKPGIGTFDDITRAFREDQIMKLDLIELCKHRSRLDNAINELIRQESR